MSLRLRLLLFIAAINVGVLLLVVWLGLEHARTAAPIAPETMVEALRVAESPRLEDTRPWESIRGVLRRRRASSTFEQYGLTKQETDAATQRLLDLLQDRRPYFRCTHAELVRVNLSPAAEFEAYFVSFADTAQYQALSSLRRVYILLCAGTVLLIAGTYLVLSRVILHPIEQLTMASRAVAAGRPPPQVPRPAGNDEVATLVDNFNRMAAEVHEYQAHLQERVIDVLGRAKAAENRLVVAQRLAATGTLAAGFAHEINNPVGGLLNAVRKLQAGNLPPERQAEYFELALDGLDRIRTIVERILHFTPRQRAPTDVDVADACRRAVQLARHRAESRGVTIELEAAERLAGVVGDPQELTQAILNLLLNAVDAIPEGRAGRIQVKAWLDAESREIDVSVTDDGVGMDAETAARCVDLFYSTKPEGEGTGLGLAIVQHIVTDHGGTLDVESAPGEGTTIRLRFPIETP